MALQFLNDGYFAGKVGIGTESPVSSLNITTTKTVALDTAAKFLTLGLTVDDLTAGNTAGGGGGIAFRSKNTNAGTQIVFGAIDAIKESANVSDFRGSLRFFTNQNSTGIPLERMRIASSGAIKFNDYGSGTFTGTETYRLAVDSSGNIIETIDGGGTVKGTGTATRVAFWSASDTLSSSSDLYWDTTDNHLGIGDSTPGSKLKVTSGTSDPSIYTVDINHVRNDADVGTNAVRINMDLSGADTTTADRTNSGLLIDIDSSANGDASNEHRIYGVNSTIHFTGFTDQARSGYFLAESNYTDAKTAQLVGVYGYAIHDASDAAGGVSNMMGVYGFSSIQDLGDVDNAFGVYGLVSIGDNRVADVGVTKAVEGEITIDKSTAINYGTMIGISSVIDNNEDTVPNFGTQYLFKGDYQGTKGSDAYGIYSEGDKHYFEGNVGIGTTTPNKKLEVSAAADTTVSIASSDTSINVDQNIGILEFASNNETSLSQAYTPFSKIKTISESAVTGTATVNGAITFETANANLISERMRIDSSGLVSIKNTGVPTLRLDNTDTSLAVQTLGSLEYYQNDTSGTGVGAVCKINAVNESSFQGEAALTFQTGSASSITERMRIDSSGNVGIGQNDPGEKLDVAGNVLITAALLSNQENTDVDTGTETVASVAIATYTAAFFDFVIKKTTNVRSGTVYACHDGTNVEFTETSTQDLGDTSDVTLSVDISGTDMRLRATTTSDDWSVKSLIRAI